MPLALLCLQIEGLPEVECAAVFVVQLASGVFRPLRSGQPLLAPAAASKPRTTATNMEELLDGLEDFSLQTPIPTPRQELEGLTGEQDEAGRAVLSPSPTLSEPGRISPAMNVPREGASGHMRRAASLSDVALLRRASQPGLLGAEPALARQLVWTRSLKDAPERVLQVRLPASHELCRCEWGMLPPAGSCTLWMADKADRPLPCCPCSQPHSCCPTPRQCCWPNSAGGARGRRQRSSGVRRHGRRHDRLCLAFLTHMREYLSWLCPGTHSLFSTA